MEQIYNELKQVLNGWKKFIYFIFSLDGIISGKQFALMLFLMALVFQPVNLERYSLKIAYVVELVAFYCVLLLVQKRCRDFGSKGTWWILAVTFSMIFNKAFQFIDMHTADGLWGSLHKCAFWGQLIIFLPLLIIPSKPDADINLRSLLLKYPLLYTAVCWVLAIVATLAVSHYAGIEVF